MLDLVESTSREGVDVKVVPDLLQFIALRARLEDLDGVPIINLNDVPLQGLQQRSQARDRRRDLGAARCSCARRAGIIARLIKRTSPGRCSTGRSAWASTASVHGLQVPLDARWTPRTTPARSGRARTTRAHAGRPLAAPLDLDELPQFWNVLRGDMSIVGPRPERPFFVEQFKHRIPQYMLRHKVKAGITGWAQVNGWRGNTSLEKRIEYDLYYIENWSVARPQDHVADAAPRASTSTRTDSCRQCGQRSHAVRRLKHLTWHNASSSPAPPASSDRISPKTLLDRGYAVVGIDNLLTGDIANIAHLRNRDFEFIKHDVTNYIYVDGPVDFVLHWASPASPIDYLELPIPTLKVGALGTHKALGLAKAKRARFVIASTSEVYGDPLEHPQKETYWGNVNPIGPRGVYDEAKRFAEAMTMAYHRYHGLDTKIVRIFNTYGPRMRINDGRAVPAFMSQALRNEDVTIFGDGTQTRSFCYVSDLVDGIIRLMVSDVNDPVNIGNPHEMTIEEIARTIIEMTGSTSQLVYKPLPSDDPKVRQPDITRARTLLGWEPKVGRSRKG